MQGEKTMYQVRKVAAGGMLAAAAVTGGAIGATLIGNANAATPSTAASSSTSSSAASPGVPQARGNETALTGDTLAKATAAAKAKVPGATVDRAEIESDGSAKYEVHMTKTDGSHVTVKLDAAFKVTSVDTNAGRGGHGPGGPGGRHAANGITETPLTGTTLAKATAAAKAAVPGATVDRAETDAEGAKYEVHMTKSDGSHVTVKLDAAFKVTKTVDGQG
jgi:uncharacterized membrane protein YkoI